MSEKIQVDTGEVKELFFLLEELNDFLHQPMHYENPGDVEQFLQSGAYERLRRMYYDVVWNWLPPQVQQEIEERAEEPQYSLVNEQR